MVCLNPWKRKSGSRRRRRSRVGVVCRRLDEHLLVIAAAPFWTLDVFVVRTYSGGRCHIRLRCRIGLIHLVQSSQIGDSDILPEGVSVKFSGRPSGKAGISQHLRPQFGCRQRNMRGRHESLKRCILLETRRMRAGKG